MPHQQRNGNLALSARRDDRLGAGDVPRRHRQRLIVERGARRLGLVVRNEGAIESDLIDCRAVERKLEGFPQRRARAQGGLCRRALIGVDRQHAIADRRRRTQAHARIVAHRRNVSRRHALDDLQAAGAQVGEPHRVVGDRQIDDTVDVDGAFVPVLIELVEDDAILRDPLDETVGPGADRVGPEFVAELARRLRRHHHAGAVRELGQQRDIRLGEVEPHRVAVDDGDRAHRLELGLAA
ncbi:MAG TPA: hypothetical protein VGG01_00120 [Xanthobacteraceae bacterium]